jgi:hypothetical protein
VLDHVFHGVVRSVCVVVIGHGEPQNKNGRIVATPGWRAADNPAHIRA